MPCVEELNRSARNVLAECLRTGWDKIWIVLAPDCKQRRLELSEVIVEGSVELNVVDVIEKKVELNVGITWSGQEGGIQRVPLRLDKVKVRNTGAVFPPHALG